MITAHCRQQCSCSLQTGMTCRPFQCPAGASCQLSSGRWGCVKQDGLCSITRGDIFTTFDGISGKMPPDGVYEISSLLSTKNKEWFRVVVDIQGCHKCPSSRITTVTVFFHQLTILVQRDGKVLVRSQRRWSIHPPIHHMYSIHPCIIY